MAAPRMLEIFRLRAPVEEALKLKPLKEMLWLLTLPLTGVGVKKPLPLSTERTASWALPLASTLLVTLIGRKTVILPESADPA